MGAVTPEARRDPLAFGEWPRKLGDALQHGTISTAGVDHGWTDDPKDNHVT